MERTPDQTKTQKPGRSKIKKRKRTDKEKRVIAEEQYSLERSKRYAGLLRMATKSILREGKVVKSFECQKVVRKLKGLREEGGGNPPARDTIDSSDEHGVATKRPTAAEKRKAKIDKLETKLKKIKAFDFHGLVDVCLTRLGIHSLAPISRGSKDGSGNTFAGGSGTEDVGSVGDARTEGESGTGDGGAVCEGKVARDGHSNDDSFTAELIESLLRHKRLSSAMDALNDKVTEHRRWVMRREEYLSRDGTEFMKPESVGSHRSKKMKRKKGESRDGTAGRHGRGGSSGEWSRGQGGGSSRDGHLDMAGHGGTSGLFIGSLSGAAAFDGDGREGAGASHYGPAEGSDDEYSSLVRPKKNRRGQRARKAKAMAIEARKAGKVWDSSINWREKKQKVKDPAEEPNINQSASGLRADVNVGSAQIATMGKKWKEKGQAHPSWAAKQSQKAKNGLGIVEFAGKKITFD